MILKEFSVEKAKNTIFPSWIRIRIRENECDPCRSGFTALLLCYSLLCEVQVVGHNSGHDPGLWIRIRMDPHSFYLLDPDPQKINADPLHSPDMIHAYGYFYQGKIILTLSVTRQYYT